MQPIIVKYYFQLAETSMAKSFISDRIHI